MPFRTFGRLCAAVMSAFATLHPAPAAAQSSPATFKVGFFNIQSGKGEPPLPGRPSRFADTANCTDPSQPVNAWGIGFVQQHLTASLGNDPLVVALGLTEAWVCGSPENVRQALGWRAASSERNGVAMVARHGFAGPEEWLQLDTSLNLNPADTMWVLRVPVCLDAGCSRSLPMFTSHWLGSGADPALTYDRQARATVDFMTRTAGRSAPSLLVADLNVWEGPAPVCGQTPIPAGLPRLRDAGYVDGWPLLHGSAEGFTGMVNRANCGSPAGYGWKRIDYVWSPPAFLPLSLTRFGVVPAGDEAPSDHYGLLAEFPMPAPAVPADTIAPVVSLLSPADGLTVTGGSVSIAVAATDDVGVTRVEILEDGVLAHTLAPGQTAVACAGLSAADGTHTVVARAFDQAGNIGLSAAHRVVVRTSSSGPLPAGEIVLHAKGASLKGGAWQIAPDASAAGGARLWNPDAGVPKLPAPQAAPASYAEITFIAEAGRPYRLWLRGRAERDAWANDSVFVQFSGSVDAAGVPAFRIGTAEAAWVAIEDCQGCGLSGWGWQDNGYGPGVLGPLVRFAAGGRQTIRLQSREDGVSIDQIVLSPATYLTASPGAARGDSLILPQAPDSTAGGTAEILLTAAAVTRLGGAWSVMADASAAGALAVGHADAARPKVASPAPAPVDYVEFTFEAQAGVAYRLWVRGRADRDAWSNDSIYVQFGQAVDAGGAPAARTGTADAWIVNLEEAANSGLSGWGWQDNGYGAGVLGPLVRFGTSGLQTLRIQTREDGLRIDQIVLSSSRFLSSAPGSLKNDTTILR